MQLYAIIDLGVNVKKDDIDKFLAMTMVLGGMYGITYTDDYCFCNEKLLGYSVNLVCEIDDFLEEGFTKEEIISFINESDFTISDPDLSKEEGEYLRKKALSILDIRYELFVNKNGFSRTLERTTLL